MVFSSTIFLFLYLPITLGGYYLLPKIAKNYWLLIMSLIFFAWQQPSYIWIILVSIVVNYTAAVIIERLNKTNARKFWLCVVILINLSILFYYKYLNFSISIVNGMLKVPIEVKDIVLPIGISFFTFQGLSYVIDVYRREVKAQKSISKLALYITLFPQLIAGPIVRYQSIADEIDNRRISFDEIVEGIKLFILGLTKKVLIANTLAVVVDSVWNIGPDKQSISIAWIASIAYTLQIYFDFSGYSDMAIGLGQMLGFHFDKNFNLPYISNNITEFWRRWHISLSSWFRDYVYIPLGGNRKRVYLNLLIVFVLTGVWHGASWNFIIWGCWNAFFILVERFVKTNRKTKDNLVGTRKNQFEICLKKIYTLLVVNIGWVLFRAPNLTDALNFIKVLFGMGDGSKVGFTVWWYLDRWTLLMLAIGILFSTSLPDRLGAIIKIKLNQEMLTVVENVALLFLFILSIIRVISGTYNPFIYFQF